MITDSNSLADIEFRTALKSDAARHMDAVWAQKQ